MLGVAQTCDTDKLVVFGKHSGYIVNEDEVPGVMKACEKAKKINIARQGNGYYLTGRRDSSTVAGLVDIELDELDDDPMRSEEAPIGAYQEASAPGAASSSSSGHVGSALVTDAFPDA